MMNTKSLFIAMVTAPLNYLKIPYEEKEEGDTVIIKFKMEGLYDLFRSQLQGKSLIKTDKDMLSLVSGNVGNVDVEKSEDGIVINAGELGSLKLSYERLARELDDLYKSKFGNKISVTLQGNVAVITVANVSQLVAEFFTRNIPGLKIDRGKVVFSP